MKNVGIGREREGDRSGLGFINCWTDAPRPGVAVRHGVCGLQDAEADAQAQCRLVQRGCAAQRRHV